MNKNVLFGLLAVAILVGGVLFATGSSSDDDSSASNSSSSVEPVEDNSASEAEEARIAEEKTEENSELPLTTAEVAKHASEDDCWTIVDGVVYDITQYLPRHPGGDTVLLACGTDGTSLFQDRTTSDGETIGSGRPHSGGAESQLEGFKLGDLES